MNTETAQPRTPYDALGGSGAIQSIVERFYDLIEGDPAYAELRAMHAADLAPMRRSLAGWLCAWAGGPRDWLESNPGKCMMSLHRDLGVSRTTADQWADAMARAIAEFPPHDRAMGQVMAERLDMMARAMVIDPAQPST